MDKIVEVNATINSVTYSTKCHFSQIAQMNKNDKELAQIATEGLANRIKYEIEQDKNKDEK